MNDSPTAATLSELLVYELAKAIMLQQNETTHHPITMLRKMRPDKQRLAFMYQMIRQMASGKETFGLRARVTFGEIIGGATQQHVLDEVAAAAQRTFEQHLAWRV